MHAPRDLGLGQPAAQASRIFTPGNVLAMLLGSVVLGAVYPYLILKTGLVSGITMVSSLLTLFLLKVVFRRKTIDAREANLIQTAMTTAANVGFMATVIAALDMLGINLSPGVTFFWLLTSAGLGTMMAVPLRRQLIEVEELPYPHGKAVGEMLNAVADPEGPGAKKTRAIGIGGGLAVAFVSLRDGLRWIPPLLANSYKVGVEPSLMLLGLGAIMGLRTSLWLMISALAVWGVLAPELVRSGVASETANIFGMQKDLARGSYYLVLMRWTMWPAIMLLLSSGLTSIALKWRLFADSLRSFAAASRDERTRQDMPLKQVAGGALFFAAGLCVVQLLGFGINPLITLVAVLVSVPLMLVGLRIKGETGIGPISIVASMVQLFFGAVSPGNIAANMAASGTTASVAIASENLMDDMKAARGVGNRPQSLTVIQLLIGIPMGALMTTLVYPLLKTMYGFGENGLPAPTAHKWQGLAEILSKGWGVLPQSSVAAIVAAVVVGVALALLEERWPKWTPSAMGIGTAFLLPASTVLPMAIGSVCAALLARARPQKSSLYLVPAAAGLIAGEAVASLLISLMRVLGVL